MLAAALQRLTPPPAAERVESLKVAVDGGRGQIAVTVLAAKATPTTTPTAEGAAKSETGRPLVLLLHGLGDTSATFRLLAPRIADAGYTAVVPDLRGCGQSSTDFASWLPEDAGRDALAVAEVAAGGDRAALEARGVVLVGHSYSAASAVWAAAEAPRAVRGVVFIGPFVRDPNEGRGMSIGLRWMLRVLMARPIGPGFWAGYYANTLHKHPELDRADLQRHTAEIRASLDAGHLAALRGMMFATKGGCEKRLPEVRAPSLTVIGSADPDYPVPADEAAYIAKALASTGRTEQLLVDRTGHYPHFEQPGRTADAVVAFLNSL